MQMYLQIDGLLARGRVRNVGPGGVYAAGTGGGCALHADGQPEVHVHLQVSEALPSKPVMRALSSGTNGRQPGRHRCSGYNGGSHGDTAPNGLRAEVHGDLAAILAFADRDISNVKLPGSFKPGAQLSVVAREGFEPPNFRL